MTTLGQMRAKVRSELGDSAVPYAWSDGQLNEWLNFHGKPHLIVATKADKISNNELRKSVNSAEKKLDGTKILAYSAQTGRGRDEVWAEINEALNKS